MYMNRQTAVYNNTLVMESYEVIGRVCYSTGSIYQSHCIIIESQSIMAKTVVHLAKL
jgi:hypothetical protein